MSQNTSHAVMSQRVEPHDSLGFFPTRPWATRALCEWLRRGMNAGEKMDSVALEPACGAGDMARPLAEYFTTVFASDVHDYGHGYPVADFLFGEAPACDWMITNPPFRLALEFIQQGLRCAQRGVAVIVRTAFLEGQERHRELFSVLPPSDILQFTERVPMHRGRLEKDGTTATAYCWIVWDKWNGTRETRFHWIAPCRKRLERASDYAPIVPHETSPSVSGVA